MATRNPGQQVAERRRQTHASNLLEPVPLTIGIDFQKHILLGRGLQQIDCTERKPEALYEIPACLRNPLRQVHYSVREVVDLGAAKIDQRSVETSRFDSDREYPICDNCNSHVEPFPHELLEERGPEPHGI